MAKRILKSSQSDLQLISDCIAGNRPAQSRLYHRYAQNMLNTAYRIVWNEEDARDVLQEAFLSVFDQLPKLKTPEKLGGWIKRIVVNTAITKAKKNGQLKLVELTDDIAIPTEEDQEKEDNIPWSIDTVKEAMNELPNGYKTVLNLYLIEGYDHQEIAEILGIAVSTSLTQYKRGKQKLKNSLLNRQANGYAGTIFQKKPR